MELEELEPGGQREDGSRGEHCATVSLDSAPVIVELYGLLSRGDLGVLVVYDVYVVGWGGGDLEQLLRRVVGGERSESCTTEPTRTSRNTPIQGPREQGNLPLPPRYLTVFLRRHCALSAHSRTTSTSSHTTMINDLLTLRVVAFIHYSL